MNDILSQPVDQQALALTHSIALQESSKDGTTPNYNAVGDAGTSKGAYQWQPGNFEAAAKSAGLDPNDFSPENQDKVAYSEVKAYKDKGYDPGQIASLWNSGSPNNWQNHSGTTTINGQQIKYDTPSYVKGVQKYYQQLQGQQQTNGYVTQASLPPGTGQPEPAPGFLQQASGDISSAAGGVANAVSQTATGKINPISGLIQGAGSIAGGVNNLINDTATNLPIVGGIVKGAEGLLGQGISAAANTGVGKAVTGDIQQFSQAHPELAGDIGGAANIAGLVGTFYGGSELYSAGKEALGEAIAKGTFGDTLAGIADKSATNEALDIVSPQATKSTLKAGIKSGEGSVGGLLKTATLAPDADTVAAANAIKPLVKAGLVGSEKTAIENSNAILKEIGNEANSLRTQLAGQEIKPIISAEDLGAFKAALEANMKDNFTLVGNSELYGQKAFDKFFSLLPTEGDITAEDILDARQGLDKWAKAQRGSKIFDPATANAQSEGLRIVRQGANGLIAKNAPSIAVKESLARQSALYDALDNVATKGTKEIGTTGLGRFAKRHPVVSGLIRTGAKYGAMGAGMKTAADLIP